MERAYWLNRQLQALAMARRSSNPAGRSVHIELARRFGVEADHAPPEQTALTVHDLQSAPLPISKHLY